MWLVRHAIPLIAPGVCYGALDVAADLVSTLDAAQRLAQQLPQHTRVRTSPLQRCELLAQHLHQLRPDLSYKTDARLAEMNFGCWEGQRWDSVPKAVFDAWLADFWHHRFGGAESVAEFMGRVALAWQDTEVECVSSAATQTQVWITHAGVIRAMSLIVKGVREVHDAALWPARTPAFGQSYCLETNH